MESMGQSRTSEVQRDARIGEAECNRQDKSKNLEGFGPLNGNEQGLPDRDCFGRRNEARGKIAQRYRDRTLQGECSITME